jgi:ribonuclease Z
MSLDLLILGSGSALPTLDSNQTAQVLETESELYLIDCGEGTQIELRRYKVRMQRINHIFISHLHGDHFFGLVGLLSTMHLLGRKKAVTIHGPEGLEEIVRVQFRNAGSHLSYKMDFNTINIGDELIHEDKYVKVRSLELNHRIKTFGFLFEEQPKPRKLIPEALEKYKVPHYARRGITQGKDFIDPQGNKVANALLSKEADAPLRYAYCSDTAYYEPLIQRLQEVDLLYHEATFQEADRERAKVTYHSTAKDAARMANLAGVKKLLVGHFSNRYKSRQGFLKEARPIFPETYIAEEGERYEVGSATRVH